MTQMQKHKMENTYVTVKAISKERLDKFIMDARAFIAYGVDQNWSNTAILSNLGHDIFGLAIGDELMLPRVTGYEEAHPFDKSNLALNHVATGSGLGVLLPLLNKRPTGGAGRVTTAPHLGKGRTSEE